MIWIGLTGGIGAGKSEVATRLRSKGYAVIDADVLARRVLEEDPSLLTQIKDQFGPSVFNEDGTLNRQALGRNVFGHRSRLAQLESIIHPAIRQRLGVEKKKLIAAGVSLAIYDVPLLFEKNLQKEFDHIIVVKAPERVQLDRIASRDGLAEADIRERLRAQMPIDEKVRAADFVIENSGTLADLDQQVEGLVRYLQDHT